MDKIYIKDLEVYAYHGVNPQEKDMGQKFLISVELNLDLSEAARTDNLSATVNYAKLCSEIEKVFKSKKYNLIETAAEKIANFILMNYPEVDKVKVLIKKPWAPIGKPVDYAAIELERSWHRVYIGIGSNMGDKEKNIKDAVAKIEQSAYNNLINVSGYYVTKPVGYLEQDDFLNCAIEIKTLLSPSKLVEFLLDTEKDLKRERIIKWGPRTIDLDVLLYDDIVSTDPKIIIPHPRMHERFFVLKPLSDIAPYAIHPLLHKRIIDLLGEVSE